MRDPILYLEDILSSCEKIVRYTHGMTLDTFRVDDRTYDAVVRNLEIIGEAAKNLPEPFREEHAEIEWRAIGALRNVVAHEYFGVKDEIIWDIVSNKILVLLRQVQQIIDKS